MQSVFNPWSKPLNWLRVEPTSSDSDNDTLPSVTCLFSGKCYFQLSYVRRCFLVIQEREKFIWWRHLPRWQLQFLDGKLIIDILALHEWLTAWLQKIMTLHFSSQCTITGTVSLDALCLSREMTVLLKSIWEKSCARKQIAIAPVLCILASGAGSTRAAMSKLETLFSLFPKGSSSCGRHFMLGTSLK